MSDNLYIQKDDLFQNKNAELLSNMEDEILVGNIDLYKQQEQLSTLVQKEKPKSSFISKISNAVGKSSSVDDIETIKAEKIKKYSAVSSDNLHNNLSDKITSERFSMLSDMCNSELTIPHATKDFKSVLNSILK